MVSGLFGGSAVIYLLSKYDMHDLANVAYAWCVLIGIIFFFVLLFFIDVYSAFVASSTALLASLLDCNIHFLSGKKNIQQANNLKLIQVIIALLFTLLVAYFQVGIIWYFVSYLIATLVAVLLSWHYLLQTTDFSVQFHFNTGIIKQVFNQGLFAQLANLAALLNTRSMLYFVKANESNHATGLLSNSLSLVDAIWILGNSIAYVLYVFLTNEQDKQARYTNTIRFMKIGFVLTFLVIAMLFLVPSSWYVLVFGKDFQETKSHVLGFSAGILLGVLLMNISSYFSSQGKIYINSVGSFIGLIITVLSSIILIGKYENAVFIIFTTSLFFSVCWGLYNFYKENSFVMQDYFITKEDVIFIKNKIENYVRNSGHY